MRKSFFYSLFFFFPIVVSFAQLKGTWHNYTDMKSTRVVASDDNFVYAATAGGAYLFNQMDSTFKLLTKSDGLESQDLSALTLDNSNKMWIGSESGAINIYNVSTNKISAFLDIYRSNKQKKKINDLFVSGDTIFVASDFGLSLINTETFVLGDSFLKFGDFPTETRVVNSFKQNLIFLCTDKGVAVQKPGTTNLTAPESWTTYALGSKINATIVYKILSFENEILLATNRGIMKFSGSLWEPFLFTNTNITDMVVSSNILYVVQGKSVYTYSQAESSKLIFPSVANINSIFVNSSNNIILGRDDGVIIIDSNGSKIIVPNGPRSNLFSSIAVDFEGNLWAASGTDVSGVGFYKFDGSKWTNFNKVNNPVLKSNAYHKVFAGNNDKVYFCNWGQGFLEYKKGEMTRYDTHNSPMIGTLENTHQFLVIQSVQTDSKGNAWSLNYWSASAEPLAVITPDSTWFTFGFTNPSITNSDLMDYMTIDQFDTKWFTVRNKGLYYFNENNTLDDKSDDVVGRLTSTGGLTSGSITALTVDNQGELWVGKNPGLNIVFDPANPQQSQIIDLPAFRNQLITFIAVDAINRKWVGTKTGVFLMSPDGFTVLEHYDSNNSPLPNDDIKSIAINKIDGTVFIGTDFGLSSITTDAVAPKRSMTDLFVYPNPFKIDNTSSISLNIKGLLKDAGLRIYSISGKLIRVIEAGSINSPGGSIAHWDGRDDASQLVPSGVYLIVAFDRDGSNVSTAKVAVLQK